MKKRFYDIKPSQRREMLNDFCDMISGVKDRKDAEKFLRDLLTPSELIMIMTRIEIAKMLLAGFGYHDIQKKLKVGSNTIGNVNRWLYNGFGGYMAELKKAVNQKKRRAILPNSEWDIIRKKYPAHFYIFNLLGKNKDNKKRG
jgi:TrpR-related protein YerC/YecD